MQSRLALVVNFTRFLIMPARARADLMRFLSTWTALRADDAVLMPRSLPRRSAPMCNPCAHGLHDLLCHPRVGRNDDRLGIRDGAADAFESVLLVQHGVAQAVDRYPLRALRALPQVVYERARSCARVVAMCPLQYWVQGDPGEAHGLAVARHHPMQWG